MDIFTIPSKTNGTHAIESDIDTSRYMNIISAGFLYIMSNRFSQMEHLLFSRAIMVKARNDELAEDPAEYVPVFSYLQKPVNQAVIFC